jgi:hypothetical protein
VVDVVDEVEEVLETVLDVAALLLVKLLDVVVLLLVTVLEVPEPGPAIKYPPTPATTKTTMITTTAAVVEIPVLERRTLQDPPRRGLMRRNSRKTILNSWAGMTPHLIP